MVHFLLIDFSIPFTFYADNFLFIISFVFSYQNTSVIGPTIVWSTFPFLLVSLCFNSVSAKYSTEPFITAHCAVLKANRGKITW